VFFEGKTFISVCGKATRGALLDIAGNEPVELWESENMRNVFSAGVYLGGYLYGSDGGFEQHFGVPPSLRCIDVETGDVVWDEQMDMASLISADGKLIVLEENGMLHVAEATPKFYVEIS
jgi:hypothetical protein